MSNNNWRIKWMRAASTGFAALLPLATAVAAEMPNACPVDGCEVTIASIRPAGDELEMTFKANFTPDVAKNHLHVWWGEKYAVRQVGRNARSEFGVAQGKWHRHDDYPVYVTTGAASVKARDGATTLCVTAADRGHNVLDPELYDCKAVGDLLPGGGSLRHPGVGY